MRHCPYQSRYTGERGCNPIPVLGRRCGKGGSLNSRVYKVAAHLGDWQMGLGRDAVDAIGVMPLLRIRRRQAIAGIAVAAAAASRRRNVAAQPRLSANACNRQTARTLSRPCTRKRNMPRFLMMPCARSVSLRRR